MWTLTTRRLAPALSFATTTPPNVLSGCCLGGERVGRRTFSQAATSSSPDEEESSSPSSTRNAVVDAYFGNDNPATASQKDNDMAALRREIQNRLDVDWLIDLRRRLHQCPEVMYQEAATSALLQDELKSVGVDPSTIRTGWAVNTRPDVWQGPGGYGLVVDIGTGAAPCVLLRSDMDALPIHEQTGLSFASPIPQRMHACGHDGHMSMLLGAAAVLQSFRDSLPGTVRCVFQPAEEGGAGAKRMIDEGILTLHPAPSYALGLHLWPTLPSGVVGGRPGPIMGACERFEITLHGVGGHAAQPHLTRDPIVASAHLVTSLQTIVSRSLSPLQTGVCSITKVQAGEAFNVIPSRATLRGTIRALSTEALWHMRDQVQHIVESTALTHGCEAEITYSPDFYPSTVNDAALYESISQPVAQFVSDGRALEVEPSMAAEDFSFIAESVPSTFLFVGCGGKASDGMDSKDSLTPYGLHHPQFTPDESVLPLGVELHVHWALRALQALQSHSEERVAA